MRFENSEELCAFVEKFAQKAMPKPGVEDVVIDLYTGKVFMKWEGYKFLISHNLKVEEEKKHYDDDIHEEWLEETPLAKIIGALLLMYYNIMAKREKKRNNK